MIQLQLGKLEAAEVNVEKALRIIPDSASVLDTRKLIREAKANAVKGKGGAAE